MTRRRARVKKDPFKDERPEPIEIMSRLLVGGSYREPVAGTGTKAGLQAVDIAAGAGFVRARLGREIAIAVATRPDPATLARLVNKAYRRCTRAAMLMRPRALKLDRDAHRWRLRLVIYDAAHELAYPQLHKPFKVLAKDAKMRAHDYARLHKVITAELQQLMNEACREFGYRLWGMDNG